jgi:hypothetical protein
MNGMIGGSIKGSVPSVEEISCVSHDPFLKLAQRAMAVK